MVSQVAGIGLPLLNCTMRVIYIETLIRRATQVIIVENILGSGYICSISTILRCGLSILYDDAPCDGRQ